jgi:hypothetical protein
MTNEQIDGLKLGAESKDGRGQVIGCKILNAEGQELFQASVFKGPQDWTWQYRAAHRSGAHQQSFRTPAAALENMKAWLRENVKSE